MTDGIDFNELDSEKYWSFPKQYKGDRKTETKQMILSGNYFASEKKDGVYMRLIKDTDGSIKFQGRTRGVEGHYIDKTEFVPQLQDFFNALPNGTCLLGEAYLPVHRGSKNITSILGCLKEKSLKRQQDEDKKIHYYVFDVWAYDGKSYLNKTIEERLCALSKLPFEPYVERAIYLEGQAAWNALESILDNNGEGMVLTRKGSKPEPGKRTARKTLKVKMEIENHIDAFIDGNYKPASMEYHGDFLSSWSYWINNKTGEVFNDNLFKEYTSGEPLIPITKAFYHGWASAISISVLKDSKPFHIGWISGITDELKEGIVYNPKEWINKVVEISAMEIEKDKNGNPTLRHGKIVSFRDDKNWQECDYSQIEQ